VIAVFSVFAGIVLLPVYFLTAAWQNLALSVLSFVGGGIFYFARRLTQRDRETTAVAVMVGSSMALLPIATLFWGDAGVALAVSTVGVSGVITALTVRPERRSTVWAINGLAGLVTLGVSLLRLPWPRYSVNASPITTVGSWLLIGGVLALVFWQLARAYRQTTTIRVRLALAFSVLVLLVAGAVSITSILVGVRETQQRFFDQLETAIVLRQQSIETWIDGLQFALSSLIVEQYEFQRVEALLWGSFNEDFQATARRELRSRFRQVIERTGWFTELFLVSADGEVVLSTDPDQEGKILVGEAYVQEGLVAPYVAPPSFDAAAGGASIVFAEPIGQLGQTYGVLAGRTNMDQLRGIIEQGTAGGIAYLVNEDYALLNRPLAGGGYVPAHSPGIDAAVEERPTLAHAVYENHQGIPVLGAYTWLPRLQVAMISEVERANVLTGARMTTIVNGGVAVMATLVAVLAALLLARQISAPLANLAETATQVAAGELDLEAEVERKDEIGALAQAFNAMTAQLRNLIDSLEERVRDRTRGLQAVTEVSRTTTSVLDPEELLPQVVDLVQDRFDLYYVGLFLVDREGKYAVLEAGTGGAGLQMLAEGWRLGIGGESMIGQAVSTGEPIIKQQAGDQVVSFENPLLPDTRSELALPLRYGARTIGAMTVQSVEEAAFDDTDIAVLQNMADQVAVAIQNARLFAETEAAFERASRVQQRYQTRAWSEYLRLQSVMGYEYDGARVTPLEERVVTTTSHDVPAEADYDEEEGRLLIPIRQAGQVLGVIGVERPEGWAEDDMAFVYSLAEQLALAAENQRLLDETQRREAAERLTREVTSRLREPVEMEDVLRTAADQIREVFSSDRVVVRLVDPSSNGNGKGRS
jgi:GAF domain-containing protein/HAMP domain-containing protein